MAPDDVKGVKVWIAEDSTLKKGIGAKSLDDLRHKIRKKFFEQVRYAFKLMR